MNSETSASSFSNAPQSNLLPKLYVATGNVDKANEIERVCKSFKLKTPIICAKDIPGGMPYVEETGSTYADNARLKALALKEKVEPGSYILADDSGLEVEYLNGAPGLYSARYGGPNATYKQNYEKLLQELHGVPEPKRKAQFIAVMVLLTPSGREEIFVGICKGHLDHTPSGEKGFGYDPIFIPDDYTETFATLGDSVKNQICHRFQAIKKLAQYLEGVENPTNTTDSA